MCVLHNDIILHRCHYSVLNYKRVCANYKCFLKHVYTPRQLLNYCVRSGGGDRFQQLYYATLFNYCIVNATFVCKTFSVEFVDIDDTFWTYDFEFVFWIHCDNLEHNAIGKKNLKINILYGAFIPDISSNMSKCLSN